MANILVCGGAGYIGSHMVELLASTNHSPVVLDNLSMGSVSSIPPGVPFVNASIGDSEKVSEALEEFDIDAVMHFAAFLAVGESVDEPLDYYRNNVSETVALLTEMKNHGVKYFVFSSSAAVYGTPEVVPIKESSKLFPINPYGQTKLMVERILADCDVAFGLKSTCLRYFNAAGASLSGRIGECHDPETHLIPLVLQVALGQRKNIKVFGDDYPTRDGTCIRDYIHVTDLAMAHLLAVDKMIQGGSGGSFNLGNGEGISVHEIIDSCRRITGHEIPSEITSRRPGDPAQLIADYSMASEVLGWKPENPSIDSIVKSAWQWHKSHPNGYT